MANKGNGFSQVRKNIESAIEQAEEDRKRKLLNQRLDLARAGIAAYQRKQLTEAVKNFHAYLRILEEVKNVAEGGLMPTYFDFKRDLPELLMISGVYWDLVKLYDRTQSADKQREFLHYMEKYITFSKGMPYQPLCAETLRKYIRNEKPVHRAEFKNAYSLLAEARCFIVTSLEDVTAYQTLPLFRKFRDDVLAEFEEGRRWIDRYYQVGPRIAEKLESSPRLFRKGVGLLLDVSAILMKVYFLVKQVTNSVQPKSKRTTF